MPQIVTSSRLCLVCFPLVSSMLCIQSFDVLWRRCTYSTYRWVVIRVQHTHHLWWGTDWLDYSQSFASAPLHSNILCYRNRKESINDNNIEADCDCLSSLSHLISMQMLMSDILRVGGRKRQVEWSEWVVGRPLVTNQEWRKTALAPTAPTPPTTHTHSHFWLLSVSYLLAT